MDLTEPVHRKVIGICFITFSLLGIFGALFYSYFMEFFFEMASMDADAGPEIFWIFNFVDKFIWGIVIVFLVPRIIIGFGLVNQRKWADMPAMIYGVIGLINFPLGTALGIYTLMVVLAKPKEAVINH